MVVLRQQLMNVFPLIMANAIICVSASYSRTDFTLEMKICNSLHSDSTMELQMLVRSITATLHVFALTYSVCTPLVSDDTAKICENSSKRTHHTGI